MTNIQVFELLLKLLKRDYKELAKHLSNIVWVERGKTSWVFELEFDDIYNIGYVVKYDCVLFLKDKTLVLRNMEEK